MFTHNARLAVYRYSLCIVLTSCLLAYGCSAAKDLGKSLADLAKVRAELIKKFGEEDVNLRVNTFENRTSILVMYANSALNQKTPEERAKRAQETAEIVRQHYPSIKNVSEIWIGFCALQLISCCFTRLRCSRLMALTVKRDRCVSPVALL